MDIEAYIASGILQDYAAGIATEQERREVHCLSKIYPEVATALVQAEADLESFASSYTAKAPSSLRSKVLDEVRKHQQDSPMSVVSEQPRVVVAAAPTVANQPLSATSSLVWFLAAATVAGIVFGVWQYTENQDKRAAIAELSESNAGAAEQLLSMDAENNALEAELSEAYNPDYRKIILGPVQEGGLARLALLWNSSTGEVKYDPSTLPALADDKQYQLWVLKDGVPADMGVVPKELNGKAYASSVKVFEGDAFAITIEPLGGNISPTLDQLIVIGTV